MAKNDGGTVFPQMVKWDDDTGAWSHTLSGGMSLRDWYAGMAMQGRIGAFSASRSYTLGQLQGLVGDAFEIADAMIEARDA